MRVLVCFSLLLAACGTVDPALTPGIDPARTDFVYRNAYAEGYAVGQGAAAGDLDEAAYSRALTKTGPNYRAGWIDGFETCSGRSVSPPMRTPPPAPGETTADPDLAGIDPNREGNGFYRGG